ncbi:MAG: hypothetical protein IT392_12585 [Nitrospirae bacterium]|nr:hypothetical protein [Nitrospirota bacterium]
MDRIILMKNLNAYTGRFSSKNNQKTPEKKVGWYIEDNLLEKIPILALRNRGIDSANDSPFSWKRDRNLRQAITLALETLKAWQAFRPGKAKELMSDLIDDMPGIIVSFQKQMSKYDVGNVRDILHLEQDMYNAVLKLVAKTVAEVSAYKTDQTPMLGSKIMHFLYPEFFPVWDTGWIKNKCLINEPDHMGAWLPKDVLNQMKGHSQAAATYSHYFSLMLKDLDQIGAREYRKMEDVVIRHAEIPREVIEWHFYDITPIVFEFCLLGKHIE